MSENKAPIRRGPRPGGHGPGGMMPGEKAKNFKGTMKKLLEYMGKFKFAVILVVVLTLFSTVFNIVGPKILGTATTEIATGVVAVATGTGTMNFAAIGKTVLILLGLYIISAVFLYLQQYIMTGVSMGLTYRLRRDISQKINRMPLGYFDRVSNGEILSRITNDVDTVNQNLNQSITQIISSAATIIGVLVMMLSISGTMTIITIISLPISLIVVKLVVKKSQPHFMNQQKFLGDVNGHIEEMYGGHLVVRAYNKEEDSLKEFNKFNDKLYKSAWKSQFLSGLMMPFMRFIGNLGYVFVCLVGGALFIKGKINIGDIQAFTQYSRNFTQPIQQLANISNVMQSTAAAAERVFEFLSEEEEIPETTSPVSAEGVNGDVSFKNVQFGYNDDKIIIHNFSAEVKAGQTVAIVGPTGAGKTTMVKLLMRYYDVFDGAIYIDGEDIRRYTRNGLRSAFGMVLQDTWLYNGTIMENIRYGRLDATDEEVIAAAKAAQAHSFIKTLPGGYNMVLNEEASNISQGQKQLLTIARAILSQPKVLILDEATSSVDTRTEMLIQKAMTNFMKGKTSFVIAHRLSTIRNADLILVMNNGDIVETGTHDELMQKGGFYYDLYQSQFEQTAS